MAKQTKKQAIEERTRPGGQAQQRLAARKEATKRGAETRRRKREEMPPEVALKMAALKKHEAKLIAQTKKKLDAEAAAEAQAGQPEPPKQRKARPEGNVAQRGRAGGPMATVALRGEQAEHFRALAAKQGLTLSKLLVRMIEVFEAQAG